MDTDQQTAVETQDPDIAQLDRLIAADEAADAAAKSGSGKEAQPAAPAQEPAAPVTEDGPGEKPGTGTPATPKKGDAPKQDEPKTEVTPYQKAKAREASAWKKIEAEKAAIAKERAEFEAAKKAAQEKPQEHKPEFTAEQYDAAAVKFEAQGKFDLADAAKAEAEKLRKSPPAPAAPAKAPDFEAKQAEAWRQAEKDFPEAKDPANPLNAAAREFIQQNQDVLEHPRGPYWALAYVSERLRAARVPDLETKLAAATKRNKELEALVSIAPGGSPQGMPAERSFNEMTASEQERALDAEISQLKR